MSPSQARLVVAGLVVVGVLLRLSGLEIHSLCADEGGTLLAAFAPDPIEVLRHDHMPPLTHFLLRAWVAVFGESDTALRLPGALASTGSLVAFAALARRWSTPTGAVLAVALWAISPAAIWFGREVRMYGQFELCCVLVLWLTARALDEGVRWRTLGLVALATAAGVGFHYMAGLLAFTVPALCAIAMLRRGLPLRDAVRLTGAPLVGILVWMPWVVLVIPDQMELNPVFLSHLSWKEAVAVPARHLIAYVIGAPAWLQPWMLPLAALALLSFGLFVLRAAVVRGERELFVVAAFVAPVAGLVASWLVGPQTFLANYLTAAAPASVLAIAGGIAALRPRPLVAPAFAVLFVGCLALTLSHRRENLREDYRAALVDVRARLAPGDRILSVAALPAPWDEAVLRHYLRDEPEVLASLWPAAEWSGDPRAPFATPGDLHVLHRRRDYSENLMNTVRRRATLVEHAGAYAGDLDYYVMRPKR